MAQKEIYNARDPPWGGGGLEKQKENTVAI